MPNKRNTTGKGQHFSTNQGTPDTTGKPRSGEMGSDERLKNNAAAKIVNTTQKHLNNSRA